MEARTGGEEPTEAQKRAGNYKKVHLHVVGMRISFENPKGSVRSSTDANGKKWVIQTGDKNAVIVLDVYSRKDNVEIVGWRKVDASGLEKMKRQAKREGGQFLILSPDKGSAAALSALPFGVSSDGKGNDLPGEKQAESAEKTVGKADLVEERGAV